MSFSNERALTAPLIILGIYKLQTREYTKQGGIASISNHQKQATQIN